MTRWLQKTGSTQNLNPSEPPADRGLVLICEKCGHNEHTSVRDLRSELKSQAKESGHKRDVRVVLTSCMSLCPKRGIAVAVAKNEGPTEFFVVEGEANASAGEILGKLA